MPGSAERSHHLIVCRFPILGFFLPDCFNLPVLFFGYGTPGDLFIPVACILPVASWVLLNVFTETGEVQRFNPVDPCFVGVQGRSVEVHGGWLELKKSYHRFSGWAKCPGTKIFRFARLFCGRLEIEPFLGGGEGALLPRVPSVHLGHPVGDGDQILVMIEPCPPVGAAGVILPLATVGKVGVHGAIGGTLDRLST